MYRRLVQSGKRNYPSNRDPTPIVVSSFIIAFTQFSQNYQKKEYSYWHYSGTILRSIGILLVMFVMKIQIIATTKGYNRRKIREVVSNLKKWKDS